MITLKPDEVAPLYATYGVPLSGVEESQLEAALEDTIASVIENPPPGRFVSTMPALIVKNWQGIDFDLLIKYLGASEESLAKLGYILDVTIASLESLTLPENSASIIQKLATYRAKLPPAKKPVVWVPKELIRYFDENDLQPQDEFEKRWNVAARFTLEDFARHIEEYVLHG